MSDLVYTVQNKNKGKLKIHLKKGKLKICADFLKIQQGKKFKMLQR